MKKQKGLLEASKAPSSLCSEVLVKCSRDAFALFRLLAPFVRKDMMMSSPRLAMLHRNDCDYLANHLLFIG